jgi:hypothetical protein
MTDATYDALLELLSHCNRLVARNQELLDRWKDRPRVDKQQIDMATRQLARWTRSRDALRDVLRPVEPS